MSRTVPYVRKPKSKPRISRASMISALGIERKYFDVAVGFNISATNDWTGSEVGADMPQLPQGDDQGQREGRKILLSRVSFRGSLVATPVTAATAVTGSTPTRVVLVRNYQPNGVSMNGEDVMGLNSGGAASSIVAVHAYQNPVSFGRTKIVDDVLAYIEPCVSVNNASATTVSTAFKERPIKLEYRPKTPISMQWATNATAVPTHNSFNILANTEAIQATPSLQGIIRFYYTDA